MEPVPHARSDGLAVAYPLGADLGKARCWPRGGDIGGMGASCPSLLGHLEEIQMRRNGTSLTSFV